MVILGLNYYFHDSTACIVKNGKLVAAIEEERLNRDKHTRNFPMLSIDRCLKIAELNYNDIDHIAVSIKPTHNLGKKITHSLTNLKTIKPFINHELVHGYNKQKSFWNWFGYHWDSKKSGPQVHFIQHHFSHAPGSFFVSPYKEAALLGIDGSGEWATTWLGYGKDNEVYCLGQSYFPHSLGSFYEAVTQFCGFRTSYDEGKTMGLAPMGDPEVFLEEVNKIVSVDPDGQLKFDLSYFNYQNMSWKRCSEKFFKIFGEPRQKDQPFQKHHMDVAAAFQRVLENKVLEICDILYEKTKAKHLVISGGVSLNSVMNGRIVRESPFDDIYVMPAAGDNGTAIGAAYYLYNGLLKHPRTFVHLDPYVGTSYTNSDIEKVLKGAKLPYETHEDICDIAAKLLEEGKIIGWFQGAMEIGPRALGSRSILANPAYPDMKDKINSEVKFREAYRPFAPSAIVEAKNDFFDLEVEAPFMLKICNVLKDKQSVIPAVTHVDGSARLQTVNKELHPRYYELIKKLGERTGVPVVLNTSFNIQGEPVVESPQDAIRCFFSTGLDYLVIGDFLISKKLD
ncbi:carbamoyltransferase C-terminal domain-containing protein [Mangrovimonas sp. DI 80]|uniref:carbamoyltransferase family protein n=1 Tax=Mangrovimonas sp. DI 80 TaxID=1779330 RepID=UPI00097781C0|nr:carbamoyltransferase C-terminal domain-containing protein [Mangrovimonas sp. DI 80]OMP30946.1 carbamoyltransferase [Mangrovimonas sp. DI 80]